MKKIVKLKIKKYVIEGMWILVGSFIMAVGISLFLLPNQLSSGGFTGLATVLYYFLKVPIGRIIILINIPLFIIVFFRVGKEFFVKAIVGTAFLSIFLDILDFFNPLTEDRFLACIYGGIITGIGTAIILRSDASTGGTDLLSIIIRTYNKTIKISSTLVILDIVIVIINMIFFKEIEIGLYSAITIYIIGKMLDIFFEGIYFTKTMFIISEQSEKIAEKISEEIERGVTRLIWKRNVHRKEKKCITLCSFKETSYQS